MIKHLVSAARLDLKNGMVCNRRIGSPAGGNHGKSTLD
jgi:hypothetical protein